MFKFLKRAMFFLTVLSVISSMFATEETLEEKAARESDDLLRKYYIYTDFELRKRVKFLCEQLRKIPQKTHYNALTYDEVAYNKCEIEEIKDCLKLRNIRKL